jgi:predicted nucleic-acid-binding protein
MRAVDTNVLVGLLTRGDVRQTASAESFIAQGAWVSVLGLAEAVRVLDSVYQLSSAGQAKAVEMLLSHRQLAVQDHETIASALALFRAKPSLGFSECLMLEMARKAGHLPLGTFDRNLGKIGGAQKL